MPDTTISTFWGDIYFEDNGDEYLVFPSSDFMHCVLYKQVTGNPELLELVTSLSAEDPLLWRESDEYGNNRDAAYVDFVRILKSEFDIPVIES